MGIRFFCPNGHSLNVKSELAGKIGFCPECNVRMIIPENSIRRHGELFELGKSQVAQACPRENAFGNATLPGGTHCSDENLSESSLGELIRRVTADSATNGKEGKSNDVTDSSRTIVNDSSRSLNEHAAPWFVSSADRTQQYGPATEDVIHNWISERRITPSMLVYRPGWKDWEVAENIFPEIKQIFESAFENSGEKNDTHTLTQDSKSFLQSNKSELTRKNGSDYLTQRQKRVSTSFFVICALIGLSLVLLGILVFLLLR